MSQEKKMNNFILIYSIKIILYKIQSEKIEKVAKTKFPAVLYIVRKKIQKKILKKSSCKNQENARCETLFGHNMNFWRDFQITLKITKIWFIFDLFRLLTIFISF